MPATINLKLYDIDGCLYHGRRQGEGEAIEKWLFTNNQYFLEQETAQIKREGFSKVILGYGTNRQDNTIDMVNVGQGKKSCAPALPLLQHYFNQQVGPEVVLDPFLMADLYGDKTAGESYKAILRTRYQRSIEAHAEWMFDHTKTSLIYAHAHRVAALHPAYKIVIDFYDDKEEILDHLSSFFSQHKELLPKNVVLRLHKYNGRELRKYHTDIPGSGKTDTRYDWSVRYMSAMSYFFGSGANEDKDITTAEQLRRYHNDDHYHARGHKMEMKIKADFNVEQFKHFRDHQVSLLKSNPAITQTPNYTTAVSLQRETLLPANMVQEEEDFDIPDNAHNAIMSELNQYINSRSYMQNDTCHLTLVSRLFRDSALTREKVGLVEEFRYNLRSSPRNFSALKKAIRSFSEHNMRLENRKDFHPPLTKSGLGRTLNRINAILDHAKPLSNLAYRH